MAKVKMTIEAPAAHPDVLDVRDALEQVKDLFELLSEESDSETLAWNLTAASTNSPLTVEAEAVSLRPDIEVRGLATRRISEARRLFDTSGTTWERSAINGWSPKRRRVAVRLLKRNRQSVGRTRVEFLNFDGGDLVITPSNATGYLRRLDDNTLSPDYLIGDRSRVEFGSLEGEFIEVGADRGHPAFRILERKSREPVWCRVREALMDEFSNSLSIDDIWKQKRVRVRGEIQFAANGKIKKVFATAISHVAPRRMSIGEITDKDFTGGQDILDYLDKLREGELG
ncbi:hypothetical protein [Parvularcula sp. LCG005]|uniref:hypothetical protein n=1 Tax=Parvularcula sp. LCG005 TaxID=3078805 RepID=UPI0029420C44|nr:hypothetical protein [Parvularcula sp. LCG005]WOI53709.1 hypothetical protein RUI03_01625 [Parvularcula sp. LCG005]